MPALHRLQPHEWARLRTIRLQALREAPYAFGKRWEDEAEQDDAFWQARLANPRVATLVAESETGDVGLVTGTPLGEGEPTVCALFGMWVDPTARGQGVGTQLIHGLIQWARSEGYQAMRLGVVEDNRPAYDLYVKLGFVPTGESTSLGGHHEGQCEHHLERTLELLRDS